MNRAWHIWLFALWLLPRVEGAELPLPVRPVDALTGSEVIEKITRLDPTAREQFLKQQVLAGNVPEFWRHFVKVELTRPAGGEQHLITFWVAPDYLAVGNDADHFLAPLSPAAAQAIADALGCVLPTRQMVDDIYAAAVVKLTPRPIPPSAAMVTVPVFQQHNALVREQRQAAAGEHPPGALVAGHKKDVVITPKLLAAPGKVAIYGWHQAVRKPIQPLYLGHASIWVDYSHGIRLVQRNVLLDGVAVRIETVLKDPKLSALLSDEGPFETVRYSTDPTEKPSLSPQIAAVTNLSGERMETLHFDPGVRVVINSPTRLDTNKPVRLVLYALPNGNTIEQTIGHKLKPGEDWHFDIQHIGAQTRWLRAHETDVNWVIAYIENSDKSWPTWRKKNDAENKRIRSMVESLQARFPKARLVLTGHSGGGSFTFGYLNGVEKIPDEVERIAFLDSNYAYDAALGHTEKLLTWLSENPEHYLCVLAYHDSIALLNGKTFVSESGGTWGRSLAMLKDMSAKLSFTNELAGNWQRHTALDGRVKFILRENPEKAILHTRQVEWNGFIHAMLTGTADESKGYEYFGPRAYGDLITEE